MNEVPRFGRDPAGENFIRRYVLKFPPLYRIFDLSEQWLQVKRFPGFVCDKKPTLMTSDLFLKNS